jgi:hypothetical protein
VVRALVYLPDADAERLAASAVYGRSLAVRAMEAALRAGASRIAVPSTLRDAAMDRALRRTPALAPALVGVVVAAVAVGSQACWVGCLARIRRLGRGRIA